MAVDIPRTIGVLAICAACVFLSRALPFFIFRSGTVPAVVRYLGKVLPMAVMSILVLYCIKDISLRTAAGFLPYVISIAVTAALHLWKQNTFLSIFGGTACYMLLIQLVFA